MVSRGKDQSMSTGRLEPLGWVLEMDSGPGCVLSHVPSAYTLKNIETLPSENDHGISSESSLRLTEHLCRWQRRDEKLPQSCWARP